MLSFANEVGFLISYALTAGLVGALAFAVFVVGPVAHEELDTRRANRLKVGLLPHCYPLFSLLAFIAGVAALVAMIWASGAILLIVSAGFWFTRGVLTRRNFSQNGIKVRERLDAHRGRAYALSIMLLTLSAAALILLGAQQAGVGSLNI